MPLEITDEIIDAIIQNEGRHLDRPRKPHASARAPQAPKNMAALKPAWAELPPGTAEDPAATNQDENPGHVRLRGQTPGLKR